MQHLEKTETLTKYINDYLSVKNEILNFSIVIFAILLFGQCKDYSICIYSKWIHERVITTIRTTIFTTIHATIIMYKYLFVFSGGFWTAAQWVFAFHCIHVEIIELNARGYQLSSTMSAPCTLFNPRKCKSLISMNL